MNVAFRADASRLIGSGHIMRCLTLANSLTREGAACTFICRAHPGHLGELIKARGHALRLLPCSEAVNISNPNKASQYRAAPLDASGTAGIAVVGQIPP